LPNRIGAKKRIIRWPWSSRESTRLDLWPRREVAPAGPGIVPPKFGNEPDDETPVPRTRWWWIKRGLQVFVLVFSLILIWLAITAPLSKSLQPIAPPEITLLAADGTPIARNGAEVADPVKVADLP